MHVFEAQTRCSVVYFLFEATVIQTMAITYEFFLIVFHSTSSLSCFLCVCCFFSAIMITENHTANIKNSPTLEHGNPITVDRAQPKLHAAQKRGGNEMCDEEALNKSHPFFHIRISFVHNFIVCLTIMFGHRK